jgi:hypothetical protein
MLYTYTTQISRVGEHYRVVVRLSAQNISVTEPSDFVSKKSLALQNVSVTEPREYVAKSLSEDWLLSFNNIFVLHLVTTFT